MFTFFTDINENEPGGISVKPVGLIIDVKNSYYAFKEIDIGLDTYNYGMVTFLSGSASIILRELLKVIPKLKKIATEIESSYKELGMLHNDLKQKLFMLYKQRPNYKSNCIDFPTVRIGTLLQKIILNRINVIETNLKNVRNFS